MNGAPKYHPKRMANLTVLALVAMLCSVSYLAGVWQNGGNASFSMACDRSPLTASQETRRHLDFAVHHSADASAALSPPARHFPPCAAELSEYTPCEDLRRSLKFERDRLIYRERHCPEQGEILKCLIPAPKGYRTPFPWPASRELAWFANVPHKELTVEKAVQNWIRVEGDKFRFPGGGTMFPNGADAYIDDIDRLISLRDGSIRTAIDTGCGVTCPSTKRWDFYCLKNLDLV